MAATIGSEPPARQKDSRTAAQILEHYRVEKELADRLRQAPPEARGALYATVYDELFRRVPHHPMLRRSESSERRHAALDWQLELLSGFLHPDVTFLEVGTGDCALAFEVAKVVKTVYAVDVSEASVRPAATPPNVQRILSDGSSVHVPTGSIDVAYSNQLMEHLHPDDVVRQLKNIVGALAPGGVYLCITPNRLNGPHDISGYFDDVATGLHLREYTVSELRHLFRQVGFSKIVMFAGGGGRYWRCPVVVATLCERVLQMLPSRLRKAIARRSLVRGLIGVRLVGIKGGM
jgi:SAM-dependent methyltransferase